MAAGRHLGFDITGNSSVIKININTDMFFFVFYVVFPCVCICHINEDYLGLFISLLTSLR